MPPSPRCSGASTASSIHLDGALTAPIVVALLGLEGKPWRLAIDRTKWFSTAPKATPVSRKAQTGLHQPPD
jgi:hypothetical protein